MILVLRMLFGTNGYGEIPETETSCVRLALLLGVLVGVWLGRCLP